MDVNLFDRMPALAFILASYLANSTQPGEKWES